MSGKPGEPPSSKGRTMSHSPKSEFSRAHAFPASDPEGIQRIEAHILQHVGPPESVLHEIVSDLVHIDIQLIPPAQGRDFYTLVTTGMSDLPMQTPAGLEDYRYAELLICLPPDWRVPALYQLDADEQDYWPIRWLKLLARFPHEYDTWLWASHTLPNGDPPQPFASNTRLCGALVDIPMLFGEAFLTLDIRPNKTIHFLSFIPIYREEMELKLKSGYDALIELLNKAGVTELLEPKRKNVALRSPFGSIH
jgi:Suppressor of fused protein (SUFU)